MGLFDPIELDERMKTFLISKDILQTQNDTITQVKYFKVWNEIFSSTSYHHPEHFQMMIKLTDEIQALFKVQVDEIRYSELRQHLLKFVIK